MNRALALIAALSLTQGSALAANSVLIESKAVPVSEDSVTVGVYVENDEAMTLVEFPIEIRAVTAGSFIADTLALRETGRLTNHLTEYVVKTFLPAEDNTDSLMCSGGGWRTHGPLDFDSPDAFLFVALQGQDDSCLPIGSDGVPPSGAPSIEITFGVTSTVGTFEFDTTCISPANHLLFITCGDSNVWIAPTFTKGVIEIGCECDCHTDPQCDQQHDIIDYIKVRDVAWNRIPHIPDPNAMCPVETTDVNCDGVTNNTDKNLMFGVVFLGDNPDSVFCHPCP